jgi:hypothetical protein
MGHGRAVLSMAFFLSKVSAHRVWETRVLGQQDSWKRAEPAIWLLAGGNIIFWDEKANCACREQQDSRILVRKELSQFGCILVVTASFFMKKAN